MTPSHAVKVYLRTVSSETGACPELVAWSVLRSAVVMDGATDAELGAVARALMDHIPTPVLPEAVTV